MGLKADGFRFVRIGVNDYRWMDPAIIKHEQIDCLDCTDMPDAEFEALVYADQGVAA